MAARGVWYLLLGVAAPLSLIAANAIWNFGGVLVTVAAFVWIGVALAMFQPSTD